MLKTMQNRTERNRERGVALLIALMALLLVSAISAGMIIMSNTETFISSNFRDEQTAYFSSRAGLAEIRDRMRGNATDTIKAALPSTLPGTANAFVYLINPTGSETVAPWTTTGSNYPDTEVCQEVTCTSGTPSGTWYTNPAGASGKASTTYAASPVLAWKWVRIQMKSNQTVTGTGTVTSVDGATSSLQPTYQQLVCWNGTNEIVVTGAATCQIANPIYNPVFELTALAVTPSGSRRMAQYEVAGTSLPNSPGGIVFDGPTPNFPQDPSSNAFTVIGTDQAQGPNAGAGCSAAVNEPAVGAYDAASVAAVNNPGGTPLKRPGSYQSSAPYPSVDAITSVGGQLSQFATVDGLTQISTEIINAAGPNVYTTATSGSLNLGTNAAPVINVVNGDYTLSGSSSGAGILLVTGTMTFSGAPNYNGLILVIGKGNVVKTGGGNGTVNGSILAANMYTDLTYATLVALGANNPPGPPQFSWAGGGNFTLQYDSCWLNTVTNGIPYRLVSTRELIY